MKSRKGLSTVVGMVFALIALATSVGYITYSMNILDQYDKTVIAKNQQTIDNVKENFQLYTATIKNSKFNVTVTNTGSLPINITRMWVQNTSATDWTNYYQINKLVSPGATLINIGQSSPVYANPANAYNLKLITTRGNSMQFNMGSPGVKPLFMQLMFAPNSIKSNGANATLILVVINNATSNNLIVNLQPKALSCKGGFTIDAVKKTGPIPAQYPVLSSGSTAIFKWTWYVNSAPALSSETCTVGLVNGISGNNGTDVAYSG